jgi:hypothetical protein
MRATTFGMLVAIGAAGLTWGCGGNVTFLSADDAGQDARGTDANGNDASDATDHDGGGPDAPPPWSPVCPDLQPGAGSACSQQGVQCEYGSGDYNIQCDTVMQCQTGGWQTYQFFGGGCPTPVPNPPPCPADFTGVPQGQSCMPAGTGCVYPQGHCSCDVPFGLPQIDGGTATWQCLPEPGCPMPRPRLGSACTGQMYCTYEQCSFGETCMGGVWQGQNEACAGAGSP